jgi:hypothetical protein
MFTERAILIVPLSAHDDCGDVSTSNSFNIFWILIFYMKISLVTLHPLCASVLVSVVLITEILPLFQHSIVTDYVKVWHWLTSMSATATAKRLLEMMFSLWSDLRLYTEGERVSQFSHESVASQLPSSEGVSMDAEEHPLLLAITSNDWWRLGRLIVCCSTVIYSVCRSMNRLYEL